MKLKLLADSTISSYQNRLHLFLVNHTAVCVMLLTETFIQRSNHRCLLIGAMHFLLHWWGWSETVSLIPRHHCKAYLHGELNNT